MHHEHNPSIETNIVVQEQPNENPYMRELSVDEPPEHMAEKQSLREEWEDTVKNVETMQFRKKYSAYAKEKKLQLEEALAGQRESRTEENEAKLQQASVVIDGLVAEINDIYDELLQEDKTILSLQEKAKQMLDSKQDTILKKNLLAEMDQLVTLYDHTMQDAESGDMTAASRIDGILDSIVNSHKEAQRLANTPNASEEKGPTLGMGMKITDNYYPEDKHT